MNSKKMATGSKDLISSLPDALLCHILSFLSTKDAASTSVLSTRWRFLLAFVPNLDFDNSIYDHPELLRQKRIHLLNSFKVFVDRAMALQGNAPLNKFSLKCDNFICPSYVNGWIMKALERDLVELDLFFFSEDDYQLTPKVWMSKTLVRLIISGTIVFNFDVSEVFLPKLKILHIDYVWFHDQSNERRAGDGVAKLISGCHALEELVLNISWDFWATSFLSNPNLKRVTFSCVNIDENPKSVSFDTPNLVYLEFTDTVAAEYQKVKFESLVEASICIHMTPDDLFIARDATKYGYDYSLRGNAVQFFMGISNVKILYLSSDTLEVLAFCCKTIPVFSKLIHLTIETNQDVEWDAMPNLLQNCPNLEILVFDGLHYRDTNQCFDVGYRFKDTNKCFEEDANKCICKPWADAPIWLSSSPVKTLKVLKFGEITNDTDDMDRQTDLIKYFVETMPNLEEVILYYDTPSDEDVRIVSTQFQKLEKVASSKCKIRVICDNISFLSTVYSSSSSSRSELVFFKNTFPV